MRNPGPQRAVVAAMASQLHGADPVRFFYHLGDIVYLHGEEENYGEQFLKPYAGYCAPILAIAGNHDGELGPGKSGEPLAPFVRHFCAPAAAPRPNGTREAVPQPNVYWTLEHDFVTIVGLYTDVPEGGLIADEQRRWLIGELADARTDATLILAMHHPVFSADTSRRRGARPTPCSAPTRTTTSASAGSTAGGRSRTWWPAAAAFPRFMAWDTASRTRPRRLPGSLG
jgi:hypothetical protein